LDINFKTEVIIAGERHTLEVYSLEKGKIKEVKIDDKHYLIKEADETSDTLSKLASQAFLLSNTLYNERLRNVDLRLAILEQKIIPPEEVLLADIKKHVVFLREAMQEISCLIPSPATNAPQITQPAIEKQIVEPQKTPTTPKPSKNKKGLAWDNEQEERLIEAHKTNTPDEIFEKKLFPGRTFSSLQNKIQRLRNAGRITKKYKKGRKTKKKKEKESPSSEEVTQTIKEAEFTKSVESQAEDRVLQRKFTSLTDQGPQKRIIFKECLDYVLEKLVGGRFTREDFINELTEWYKENLKRDLSKMAKNTVSEYYTAYIEYANVAKLVEKTGYHVYRVNEFQVEKKPVIDRETVKGKYGLTCPDKTCKSTHIQKNGVVHLKTGDQQRYKCAVCGRRFSIEVEKKKEEIEKPEQTEEKRIKSPNNTQLFKNWLTLDWKKEQFIVEDFLKDHEDIEKEKAIKIIKHQLEVGNLIEVAPEVYQIYKEETTEEPKESSKRSETIIEEELNKPVEKTVEELNKPIEKPEQQKEETEDKKEKFSSPSNVHLFKNWLHHWGDKTFRVQDFREDYYHIPEDIAMSIIMNLISDGTLVEVTRGVFQKKKEETGKSTTKSKTDPERTITVITAKQLAEHDKKRIKELNKRKRNNKTLTNEQNF
jgi:hypothetical protein